MSKRFVVSCALWFIGCLAGQFFNALQDSHESWWWLRWAILISLAMTFAALFDWYTASIKRDVNTAHNKNKSEA
jgi:hypothetical protein